MEIDQVGYKGAVLDIKFRNFVSMMIKTGDKARLQHLLGMSYPTLQKHLTGVKIDPSVQSQIIDYFEKRQAAIKRAANYVDKRLKVVLPDFEVPEEYKNL